MPQIANIFTEESYIANGSKLRLYQGNFWPISGPCSFNLYNICTPRSMKWFRFSLHCLAGPTGNYIKYQINRTIVGPCSGHKGGYHVRGHIRPFQILNCSFNYNNNIKTWKCCSVDTLELYGDIFQLWGQHETPDLV